MFGMMNVEMREHPRGGAAGHRHLRPAVETGAQTGAGVANPGENISTFDN